MNRLLACLLFVPAMAAAEPPDGPALFRAVMAINDQQVEAALASSLAARDVPLGNRTHGAKLLAMAASYTSEASRVHHDARLVPAMAQLADVLRRDQLPDGLYNVGNLDSPPDTAFILDTLCKAQALLIRDASAATKPTQEVLQGVIQRAAERVRTGGVHTPNHRWHVCATLAEVNELYPDQRYLDRIEDWLGEGIDSDSDGEFAERSPHYSGDVVNPALLTLAIRLKRPALLEPVRKNLEMTLYRMEPNGEIETVASRRQDQPTSAGELIWRHYVAYRYLAIHDRNGRFAAVARRIERDFLNQALAASFSPNAPIGWFAHLPELLGPLPPDEPLPENFSRVFPRTGLARVRRGSVTATIFGGSDASAGLGVASGLSTNPSFFKFRKGAAVLESVRMTPAFFGTGFFYSDGLRAADNTYHLGQTVRVPYYQPLPAEFRRPSGDYALTADGRYFSKLDFPHRPREFVTLTSAVTITERDGAFELEFNVGGPDNVPVTIELGFRKDGTLSGVEPIAPARPMNPNAPGGRGAGSDRTEGFALAQGFGRFTAGSDTIEFGPGTLVRPPGRMEGQDYTWVGGSLRGDTYRVYLTGVTPLRHRLTIK